MAEGVGPFLSFFLPQPESEQTAKSVQSTKQSAMLKNFLFIKAYLNLSKYQKNFIIYKKVCQHGFYLLLYFGIICKKGGVRNAKP